jgi:hypothetical protein
LEIGRGSEEYKIIAPFFPFSDGKEVKRESTCTGIVFFRASSIEVSEADKNK